MKKNLLFTMAVSAMAVLAAVAAAPDPVLMNIAGKDVHKSEFEYLYNKNNLQQQQSQSIDEYLGMFIDYKLKVAAAEAAGLDTMASFSDEMARYAKELARPYLKDAAVEDSIARVTYDHMLKNVDINHLMVADKHLADSLRQLLESGADWADLAVKYSTDPSAKTNGGHIGYISSGTFPWSFEKVVYDTPVGGMSHVFRTQYGYHIIKVNGERPDRGEVKVRHILKLTRGADADTLQKLHEIDSIYQVLKNGADFKEVASRETEDPSGKNNGGDLDWFGTGRMVPQFEAASFALKDGELSAPVRTAYGYHLILKEGSRQRKPFEDMRKEIEETMARDERSQMAQARAIDGFKARYKARMDENVGKAVEEALSLSNGNVANALRVLRQNNAPAGYVDDKAVAVADVASMLAPGIPQNEFKDVFLAALDYKLGEAATDRAIADLPKTEPSYANLMNEYHDGILLYEISNREVWDKPNTDKRGLEQYFEAHRKDYTWDTPRYKGYLIMAENDSVADLARTYLASSGAPDDSLAIVLRKQMGNNAKVERVLAPQGANAVIDYVAFGGARPQPVGRWASFVPFRYRIIAQPEEAADVKGALSVDYQKKLEKEWLEQLHRTYKVKLNEKAINLLK